MSILGINERRRLEAYDLEKMALLYKVVLEDSVGSVANVQRMIVQLNDRAKRGVEEEEKKKRKRNAAVSEVSVSKSHIQDNNNTTTNTTFVLMRDINGDENRKFNTTTNTSHN